MRRTTAPRLTRLTALTVGLGMATLLSACGSPSVEDAAPVSEQASTPAAEPSEGPSGPAPTADGPGIPSEPVEETEEPTEPEPTEPEPEPEPTETDPTESEPTESEPTEPEPTEPEPTEPVLARGEAPFEVAEEVSIGEYTLPVPEGWTFERDADEEYGTDWLWIKDPDDERQQFLFIDHPEGASSSDRGSAGGLCGFYNKPMVTSLGEGAQEQQALPLTFEGDVDIVTCAALGESPTRGITLDYTFYAFYDLTRPKAFVMHSQSDWEAYQADEIDKRISSFYLCSLAEQSGAALKTC